MDWKKVVVVYFKLFLRHLLVVTEENQETSRSGYSLLGVRFALETQTKSRIFIAWGYLVSSFLRNLNVHFLFHKSPLLDYILSQLNRVLHLQTQF
jgi:hypothetical protein